MNTGTTDTPPRTDRPCRGRFWGRRPRVVLLAAAILVLAGSVRPFPDWEEVAEFEVFPGVSDRCACVRLTDPRVTWAILNVRMTSDNRPGPESVIFRFRTCGASRVDEAQVRVFLGNARRTSRGGPTGNGFGRLGGEGGSGMPLIDLLRRAKGHTEIEMIVPGEPAGEFLKQATVTLRLSRPRWGFWHWLFATCRVPGVTAKPPMAQALAVAGCGLPDPVDIQGPHKEAGQR